MFVLSLLLVVLSVKRNHGIDYNCTAANSRLPDNSDVAVTCGPSNISLTIQACPTVYANFDPQQLALNGIHNDSNCLGVVDTSGSAPVVHYNIPVSDIASSTCNSIIQIIEQQGTGDFSDYSKVQSVLFSGYLDTPSLASDGMISYSTNLRYNFSCLYPMQYLIKNTQIMTSFGAVVVNSNNGSFLSTLGMSLFTDQNFTTPVDTNGTVYPLKTKIYVRVIATNLTSSFNVLLDQCFATPTPLITTATEKYVFFAGCSVSNKTTILSNGNGTFAQFNFEAFRFVSSSGQKVSTTYLHCVTRLCQPDQCVRLLAGCNSTASAGNSTASAGRRKRAVNSASTTSDPVTVSSGPLAVSESDAAPSSQASTAPDNSQSGVKELEGTLTGLIIGIVVSAILGTGLVIASVVAYKICVQRRTQANTKA